MRETPLPGGFVTEVVRVGDTVRRVPSARADFVHELLRLLEQRGWPGAPRLLGVDERGREVLTFLAGWVPWRAAHRARIRSAGALVRVAELLREFHDLTEGTALAGDREVVCHNDLSPKNTVYRELPQGPLPVAFIDWDLAAPGERVQDVAHLCWQYLDLGPSWVDAGQAGRRLRLLCDAYRLDERADVVDTVLWWQDRCWRGIESAADAGETAMIRLRDSGTCARIRGAYHWVRQHRSTLRAHLG
ncbi:phosphotransferase [Goodfellowiella coeruleoviolacea]|uniref:phosphotransferase n=1 Tax=Goodfellowiella coeruleoviolacea TaxID=334858 RepID=UPI0020A5EF43|nr:phosphotransferase [Goodfellowiella coeruleoviolacea]